MENLSPLTMARLIAQDNTLDIETKRLYIAKCKEKIDNFVPRENMSSVKPVKVKASVSATPIDPIESLLDYEKYYAEADKAEKKSGSRGKKVSYKKAKRREIVKHDHNEQWKIALYLERDRLINIIKADFPGSVPIVHWIYPSIEVWIMYNDHKVIIKQGETNYDIIN